VGERQNEPENEPRGLPELKPVPPDHPLFHGGVGFVLRSDEAEVEQPDDVVDADDEQTAALKASSHRRTL